MLERPALILALDFVKKKFPTGVLNILIGGILLLMFWSSVCLCIVQLRNLLWATSKHDVYLMQNYSVMHWSSLLRHGKEVLNVAKPIAPTWV